MLLLEIIGLGLVVVFVRVTVLGLVGFVSGIVGLATIALIVSLGVLLSWLGFVGFRVVVLGKLVRVNCIYRILSVLLIRLMLMIVIVIISMLFILIGGVGIVIIAIILLLLLMTALASHTLIIKRERVLVVGVESIVMLVVSVVTGRGNYLVLVVYLLRLHVAD